MRQCFLALLAFGSSFIFITFFIWGITKLPERYSHHSEPNGGDENFYATNCGNGNEAHMRENNLIEYCDTVKHRIQSTYSPVYMAMDDVVRQTFGELLFHLTNGAITAIVMSCCCLSCFTCCATNVLMLQDCGDRTPRPLLGVRHEHKKRV